MNQFDPGLLLADANEGLWFPQQASTYSGESDSTFAMILWVSIFFFVLIVAFMTFFAVAYRQKKGGKATSRATHNNVLEITWSVLPCFLLVVMFVRGSWGYLEMQTPPEGAVQVDLKAFKWNWTMDYGDGAFHPELHVVVDQPTKMVMRSSDVIHSFFVPAFRIKRDIVPGRYNVAWFEATQASTQASEEELAEAKRVTEEEEGEWDYDRWQFTPEGYSYFDVFCAEYCGRDHSAMQTYLVVHETQEDLDAWIKKIKARGDETPMEVWGQQLYNQRGCAGCHSVDGSTRVGPTFQNLYGSTHPLTDGSSVTVDEQYIRESILEPKAKIVAGYQPVMPSYKGQLTDDDIQSLIAYLRSISSLGTAAEESAEGDGEAASAGNGEGSGESESPASGE